MWCTVFLLCICTDLCKHFIYKTMWPILFLCLTLCPHGICTSSPACQLQILPAYEEYEYVQDGDIIIGGIFTVNCVMAGWRILEKPNVTSMLCIKPLHHYYKRLQMFLFAIDQINKNPTILPNVTLGYHLYDSCSDPGKAIKSVLQILSGPGETIPNYSCRDHQKLAGFIGDQSSTTSLPIAQMLSVYNHVQISYGVMDDFVIDRAVFPSFYQTVPGEFMIYHYISELIRHFGWTWVGIISSPDETGQRASLQLLKILSGLQICVAFIISSRIHLSMSDMSDLESSYWTIEKLSVKVIILCGTYHDVMFESSVRRLFRDVTMILPPNWASNIALIEKYPDSFNCSLSLNFWSEADKNFKNFLDGFHPMIRPKDKLLEDLWMTTLFCLSGNKKKDTLYEKLYCISLHNCTGQEHLPDSGDYSSSNRTSDPVYDAVQSMVYALNILHSCQNYSYIKCHADDEEKYKEKFNLKTILDDIVSKNKAHENLAGQFTIQNHVFVNGSLLTRSVGNFLSDGIGSWKLTINSTLINWKNKKNKVRLYEIL
ncbi:vomeronasal type-2 receptor 1-like [Lithobates pipiens]